MLLPIVKFSQLFFTVQFGTLFFHFKTKVHNILMFPISCIKKKKIVYYLFQEIEQCKYNTVWSTSIQHCIILSPPQCLLAAHHVVAVNSLKSHKACQLQHFLEPLHLLPSFLHFFLIVSCSLQPACAYWTPLCFQWDCCHLPLKKMIEFEWLLFVILL